MANNSLKHFYKMTRRNLSYLYSFVVMPDGRIGGLDECLGIQKLADFVGSRSGIQIGGVFAVVPGSFNPLHDAHKILYDSISKNNLSNRPTVSVFELSINRKDKEVLTLEELETRLDQFRGYAPVWVTNACYFVEKAGIVSNWIRPSFQIGYDTAERLIKDHGIAGVQGISADFIVYKRKIDNYIHSISDIIRDYGCCPINMMPANVDADSSILGLSSTALRNGVK